MKGEELDGLQVHETILIHLEEKENLCDLESALSVDSLEWLLFDFLGSFPAMDGMTET